MVVSVVACVLLSPGCSDNSMWLPQGSQTEQNLVLLRGHRYNLSSETVTSIAGNRPRMASPPISGILMPRRLKRTGRQVQLLSPRFTLTRGTNRGPGSTCHLLTFSIALILFSSGCNWPWSPNRSWDTGGTPKPDVSTDVTLSDLTQRDKGISALWDLALVDAKTTDPGVDSGSAKKCGGKKICSKERGILAAPQNKISAFFNGQKTGNTLVLDNSMIEKGSITIKLPKNTEIARVHLKKGRHTLKHSLRVPEEKNEISISVKDLLKVIPFGVKTTLTVTANIGKRKKTIRIQIKRNTPPRLKDPGRSRKSIQPLYARIAIDLKAGKPIVISSYVALWDKSFCIYDSPKKCNFRWADGGNPKNNLYWGGGFGVKVGFRKLGWKLAQQKEGEMAVFSKKFYPSRFWRKQGIKKPFYIYAAFWAYKTDYETDSSHDILLAYKAFAGSLFTNKNQPITLRNGKTINAGGQSHIVGYVGHMVHGGIWQLKNVKKTSTMAKGAYMTACLTAQVFSPYVLDKNIYGLLFTTKLMAPEAYNQNALFRAIARGANGKGIIMDVARAYDKYHKSITSPPTGLYVNSESPSIEKYSLPYNGDHDKDGIPNRIDPNP